MKKIALATAVSTIIASPAFAVPYYNVFTSAGISSVQGPSVASSWYVDSSSGTASNKTQPAISPVVGSNWTFDFSDLSAVAFTGTLEMGSFKTQTTIQVTPSPSSTIDGRVTYTGVKYTFSGVGNYDEATNTFTYNFLNSTVNGGGAATYSATGPATCQNGATSALGKVCASFSAASLNWEGLALNFVFSESRTLFGGSLKGIQTSGQGVAFNTTTLNWVADVPLPPAAWLFGSSLLGLAGMRRRRKG